LSFTILVDFKFGKGSVVPKPEKLEPDPVARPDEFKGAGGGMDLPRSQPTLQTVALVGEAEKRMAAVLGKMAVGGHPILLAGGRVLGGIQIDALEPFVLPSQPGVS